MDLSLTSTAVIKKRKPTKAPEPGMAFPSAPAKRQKPKLPRAESVISSTPFPFVSLPNDHTLVVFKHLPSTCLVSARGVCKRWYKLVDANAFFPEPDLTQFLLHEGTTIPKFSTFPWETSSMAHSIRTLDVSRVPHHMEDALSALTGLTYIISLLLNHVLHIIRRAQLKRVTTIFVLSTMNMRDFEESLVAPSVTTLNCTRSIVANAEVVGRFLPNLQHMAGQGSDKHESHPYRNITRFPPKLTSLVTCIGLEQGPKSITSFIETLPLLEHLNVHWCGLSAFRLRSHEEINLSSPSLTRLGLPDAGTIALDMPALVHLDTNYCERLDLRSVIRLTCLSITCSQEELSRILQQVTIGRLKKLTWFTSTAPISDLLIALPELETVSLKNQAYPRSPTNIEIRSPNVSDVTINLVTSGHAWYTSLKLACPRLASLVVAASMASLSSLLETSGGEFSNLERAVFTTGLDPVNPKAIFSAPRLRHLTTTYFGQLYEEFSAPLLTSLVIEDTFQAISTLLGYLPAKTPLLSSLDLTVHAGINGLSRVHKLPIALPSITSLKVHLRGNISISFAQQHPNITRYDYTESSCYCNSGRSIAVFLKKLPNLRELYLTDLSPSRDSVIDHKHLTTFLGKLWFSPKSTLTLRAPKLSALIISVTQMELHKTPPVSFGVIQMAPMAKAAVSTFLFEPFSAACKASCAADMHPPTVTMIPGRGPTPLRFLELGFPNVSLS